MMRVCFTARIEWLSYEQGGRKNIPPQGTRYCPLIRICDEIQNVEWSIDFICPNFKETDIIEFCFLVKEAPKELLELNREYDIFEGARKVARIQVIGCN